jgi:TrfA protein
MHTLPDIVGGAEPCLDSALADNFLKNRYPKIFAKIEAAQKSSLVPIDKAGGRTNFFLPQWPVLARGVPNGVLRSALFGAIKKGVRRYLEGERVAALDGIDIRYTGQRLDQGDLDAWQSVLHIVRLQEMGEQCRSTAYVLLKHAGKTDSGSNRNTLHQRLMRLKANAVELQQGRYSYIGSLIDDVYRDSETHEYVITLNAKLRVLFGNDQFTQVDWKVRHALDGKPLAQWLHGYYASHARPYPVNVATLLKLSGSENSDPSSGRQTLRKAMGALVGASESAGQPFNYDIRGDLVHVEKLAIGSQRRHLVKNRKSL